MTTLILVVLLGTWHGLNPAMGWLFATALGLQERRASAVVQALPPIVLGHAASVAIAIALVAGAEQLVSTDALRYGGAALLLGYAMLLLRRRVHPRRVGMRLGFGGLFVWSFVMASSHGAGLMLLPAVLAVHRGAGMHSHRAVAADGMMVLAVHTIAVLVAMTAAALMAFRLSEVGFLRRTWIDTDAMWSGALAASGLIVLAVR